MAKFTWDHIHLRTTDPEAMAQWFEKTLGAEVLRTMQQGKPRIDLKIGGANIFLAPVAPGDRVNAAPTTPYRGLDHFGLAVTGIDAIAADLKAKGVEFTREPTTIRPGVRVCFIRGPEGVSIELLDRMSISGDSARRLSSSRFRRRRTDGRPAGGAGDDRAAPLARADG
jgi:catechol 2,3-dioxygenase-like lactoylglutathione lyase family enzyme